MKYNEMRKPLIGYKISLNILKDKIIINETFSRYSRKNNRISPYNIDALSLRCNWCYL